jgi:hypothetical protein
MTTFTGVYTQSFICEARLMWWRDICDWSEWSMTKQTDASDAAISYEKAKYKSNLNQFKFIYGDAWTHACTVPGSARTPSQYNQQAFEPARRYNGFTIEEWKERAERAEAKASQEYDRAERWKEASDSWKKEAYNISNFSAADLSNYVGKNSLAAHESEVESLLGKIERLSATLASVRATVAPELFL